MTPAPKLTVPALPHAFHLWAAKGHVHVLREDVFNPHTNTSQHLENLPLPRGISSLSGVLYKQEGKDYLQGKANILEIMYI